MVYGSGLDQTSALMLAHQHNECNQMQRITSFGEIAASCGRLLFTKFASTTVQDDIQAQMPSIPRYNSQSYHEFKEECLTMLVNTHTVRV